MVRPDLLGRRRLHPRPAWRRLGRKGRAEYQGRADERHAAQANPGLSRLGTGALGSGRAAMTGWLIDAALFALAFGAGWFFVTEALT
jgi:hypothetical protein